MNFRIFSFDLGNRPALKGLMISTVLTSLSQVTAITAIIVYAVTTFQKFETFTNPYTPSIILATTLIFGSLTSSYLADKLGRKLLNCLSKYFFFQVLKHHALVTSLHQILIVKSI